MVNAEAAPPPEPSVQFRLTAVAEAAAAESPVGADGAGSGGAFVFACAALEGEEVPALFLAMTSKVYVVEGWSPVTWNEVAPAFAVPAVV